MKLKLSSALRSQTPWILRCEEPHSRCKAGHWKRPEAASGQASWTTQTQTLSQAHSSTRAEVELHQGWCWGHPIDFSEYFLSFHLNFLVLFCFVYITPKSPAKTEQGILQHCLKMKNQAFPSRMTHIVSGVFWVASLLERIWTCHLVPTTEVSAERLLARPWGALTGSLARCSVVGRLGVSLRSYHGTASQKGWRSQPRSQTGRRQSWVRLTPEPAVGSTISWSPYASGAMDRSRHGLLLVSIPPPSSKSQDGKDGLPCDPSTYLMWKAPCKHK